MSNLKFEEVSKQLKKGLYLKRGLPDVRYHSPLKYTLYYTGSNAIAGVYSTLKEVLEANNKINNLTV